MQGPQPGTGPQPIPGVQHVLAIASGKGGVGKSTVAANLAVALHMHGRRVGLMDADIYGPSMGMMFGIGQVDQNVTPLPIEKFGLKLMSAGFLLDPTKPLIWRGPRVAQLVASFLFQVPWGNLDFLVIDLPPGTGDAQLTLTQSAPLTGAIIVTTPQDISLIDARKGLGMFREVKVPVLGVIENMSHFVGDDGKRYDLFGSGGGRKLAQESGTPLLGELPIDPRVAACGDRGEPIVRAHPDAPISVAYLALATRILNEMNKADAPGPLPSVEL